MQYVQSHRGLALLDSKNKLTAQLKLHLKWSWNYVKVALKPY